MDDEKYAKAFEEFIANHGDIVQKYEKKIENDEERYTKNAKIFIEEIGKKETVVEKLKSMFENMKSKFRHIGHRDTYKKATQAVKEAFKRRDEERVEEFKKFAEQVIEEMPRITEMKKLYTEGGKFLYEKELYARDGDISSEIERIYKEAMPAIYSRMAQLNTTRPARTMLSAAFGDRY